MNLELRQIRWSGGECRGLTLLSHGFLWSFVVNQNKLTTREILAQLGYTRGCLCVFCGDCMSRDHIFLECSFAKRIGTVSLGILHSFRGFSATGMI